MKPNILCSACLLGENCRYDGGNKKNELVIRKLAEFYEVIPVCPEISGGLLVPREPAGIYGGSGKDVIEGRATVRTVGKGIDVTEQFVKGAYKVLRLAEKMETNQIVLKQCSPSCGCGKTWRLDDKFENHRADGDGVTATLLLMKGFLVYSEEEVTEGIDWKPKV